jgi:hypothetical protein
MSRCTMCFQHRTGLVQPFEAAGWVCKGCNREIEHAVGWFEIQGVGVQLVGLHSGDIQSIGSQIESSAVRYNAQPRGPELAPEYLPFEPAPEERFTVPSQPSPNGRKPTSKGQKGTGIPETDEELLVP